MEKLSQGLLNSNFSFPPDITVTKTEEFPEKVLQFGEGNFLRGFVDWMIHKLNTSGLFQGKVAIVQPIEKGLADLINQQDGLYTLYLRGIMNGEVVEQKELISSVSRAINPYRDFDRFIQSAENPNIRVIVSNTTEAGIAYDAEDTIQMTPPNSYPAKLTAWLYHRFCHFHGEASKGCIILACELIEHNGSVLREIVLRYANEWNLGEEFIAWLKTENYFLSTLVDRIVTGYPRDEIDSITLKNGYQDNLFDTAEIFHFWVIEGPKHLAEELPFDKIGLNIVWTEDMTPYRSRKVRILNGAHTMTVLGAYLMGKDTVKECMDDPEISAFMQHGIFDEIIPTLDLPEEELTSFANAVSERFSNPFIKHYLLSISLNSVSKFKARVLPSILEYYRRFQILPKRLTFSLAALICFYHGTAIEENSLVGVRGDNTYKITDNKEVLGFFLEQWSKYDQGEQTAEEMVQNVLAESAFWGTDLNELDGFRKAVTESVVSILKNGPRNAMNQLTEE